MDAETQRSAVYCELVHSVTRSCGEVRLKVTGSSMLPVIWPGDEITVKRCEYAELQSGQIVLYRQGSGLTAHRIESIAHDYLRTRGDSLRSSDPQVLPDEIVGRVVSILHNGRCIQPGHSPVSRFISLILRCSDLSRRITLYLVCHRGRPLSQLLWRAEEMQIS